MAKRDEGLPVLKKRAKVICRRDLRQVPEGTPGKVVLAVGLDWIRYWVSFENGVAVGSVNRADIATPEEWEKKLAGGDEVVAGGDGAPDDESGGGGDEGGGYTYKGILVPQRLLDLSKAARERVGA